MLSSIVLISGRPLALLREPLKRPTLSLISDHLNENCCKLGVDMGTFIKSFPSDSKEQQVCEGFALVCLLRWPGSQATGCFKSTPVPKFYHSVHLVICRLLSPFTGEDAEI